MLGKTDFQSSTCTNQNSVFDFQVCYKGNVAWDGKDPEYSLLRLSVEALAPCPKLRQEWTPPGS
jgi:hypothetical protein